MRTLKSTLMAGVIAAGVGIAGSASATLLTFDLDNIGNFVNINQNYGDRVTALSDAIGSYGELGEGFTGNVVADFGTVDPALWTTGYSDLTNVFFDDADSQGPLELVLTADAGFSVQLFDFDLGAFGADRTVTSVRVTNENNDLLYESLGDTISGATHSDYTFTSPLVGQSLRITIDQIALGASSDDVALDNVRFGQIVNVSQPVPEPATMTLLGMGIVAMAARSRRRKA
mgnify:CR=1 FL=1